MTQTDLEAFVRTLTPELQRIFAMNERVLKEEPDTLSEEWQTAALLRHAFEMRASGALEAQVRFVAEGRVEPAPPTSSRRSFLKDAIIKAIDSAAYLPGTIADKADRISSDVIDLLEGPPADITRDHLSAEVVAEVRDILARLRAVVEPPKTISADWGEVSGNIAENVKAIQQQIPTETGVSFATPDPGPATVSFGVVQESASLQMPTAASILSQGIKYRPRPDTTVIIDRLAWLLDLSPGERAFVREAADDVTRQDNLMIFADWLEDQGRAADAARVRKIVPRSGDVLIVRAETGDADQKAAGIVRAIERRLKEQRVDATVWFLPHGTELEQIDLAAMNARGWITVSQHNRHLGNVYQELRGQPEETEVGALVSEAVLRMIRRLKREAQQCNSLEEARIGTAILAERQTTVTAIRRAASKFSDEPHLQQVLMTIAEAIANRLSV